MFLAGIVGQLHAQNLTLRYLLFFFLFLFFSSQAGSHESKVLNYFLRVLSFTCSRLSTVGVKRRKKRELLTSLLFHQPRCRRIAWVQEKSYLNKHLIHLRHTIFVFLMNALRKYSYLFKAGHCTVVYIQKHSEG